MIIEDEQEIREILKSLLVLSEYKVSLFSDGHDLFTKLEVNRPDLLLLDQNLPGKNGVEIVREIRSSAQFAHLPIIMVTGLTGEDERVRALDLGADDYITKPFYPKELTSRIRAVIRRSGVQPGQSNVTEAADATDSHHDIVEIAGLVVDFTAHRVSLDGLTVALTLTEFKILGQLVRQTGEVLTRDKLRERVLDNLNVTDRTIDVHMAALRKKLGGMGNKIETVRGIGYRFDV